MRMRPCRVALEPTMLASLLASGLLWLLLLAPPWTDRLPLFAVGAAYVLVGSLVTAAVHGRAHVPAGTPCLTQLGLWLLAVLAWAVLVAAGAGLDASALQVGVTVGLWIATPAFALWHLLAVLLRGSCGPATGRPRAG